jgi:predicted acetyltransferase
MERSGPLFDGNDLLGAFHGITVAEAHGAITGYASWNRGAGYDATGKLTVYDLIGADHATSATLLHMVGSWASVAPTVVLRLPEKDSACFHFASSGTSIERRQPWMLRLVDAAAAVAARGWPPHLDGEVHLELADEACPWNQGRFRLILSGGEGKLGPGGAGTVRFTERGAGAWFAGGATPAMLRRGGLLSGGDRRSDAFLLAATAGPVPALLDYF